MRFATLAVALGVVAFSGLAAAKASVDSTVTQSALKTSPRSIGYPNDGALEGARKLDTRLPHVRALPEASQGDVRWGHPELIAMIERAAKRVAGVHKGSVLNVGHISRRYGGDLFRHRSHESGRDADLAFYLKRADGRAFVANEFHHLDETLRSRQARNVFFDTARNWKLVEGLLTDPTARVTHIFVSAPLRTALLQYAAKRATPSVYQRAAVTLMQPSAGQPHDDHFHVRIACPRSDRGVCHDMPRSRLSRHARLSPAKAIEPIAAAQVEPVSSNEDTAGVAPVGEQVDAPEPRAMK